MKLVGMLDSPYVRRVAISLQLLGLEFEHLSLSVFSTFAQFRQIDPLVKAPTLVCDDGVTLIDSTLILDYAQALAPLRRLMPEAIGARRDALRLLGLALAACEKSVQIIYEMRLRPPEKLHQPWLTRVTEQLLAAYAVLEQELCRQELPVTSASISQAGVSIAVAWHFSQRLLPEIVAAHEFPSLVDFSARAERLPEFVAAPHGESSYRGGR